MVKKLVIKVIVLVVIMVGISNYGVYLMTGRLPFSVNDITLPSVSVPKLPVGKDTAYKWVDDRGVVHYSTEPPPLAAANAKKLELDPNQNLIKGLEPAAEAQRETAPQTTPTLQSPYSPGAAQKLIEDAKNVQNLLNDRYEKQKEIIDGH